MHRKLSFAKTYHNFLGKYRGAKECIFSNCRFRRVNQTQEAFCITSCLYYDFLYFQAKKSVGAQSLKKIEHLLRGNSFFLLQTKGNYSSIVIKYATFAY